MIYTFKSIVSKNKPITYVQDNNCFVCTSHTIDKDGYPKISINNHPSMMHKAIYIDYYLNGINTLKPEQHILHDCKNKKCINPKHLKLGTIYDHLNIVRGVQANKSELTECDVLDIRNSTHISNIKLGKIYGVSDRAIGKIKRRETWTHI